MNTNQPTTISLGIDVSTKSAIINKFRRFECQNPSQYIEFFAKGDGFSIAIYKPNKKSEIKAVFQGINAESIANDYGYSPDFSKKEEIINKYPQIGSDEVGTGDFFGPICVCAAYVEEKDLPLINELGVTDSKKMTDEYILSIGPTLIKNFKYSQLSLPNNKFNEVHDSYNMNAIKAKMHNRCLLNLYEKYPHSTVYQDQFAEEKIYYSYLKEETHVLKNIIFHTKGESYFPSVALGSVIARYSFLLKMKALNEKYNMVFPFGAGKDVDDFIIKFVDKFGEKELENVAKLNWANYKKYKENHN